MKSRVKQFTAAVLVLVLLSSTAAAYKGKLLARGPVEGIELTDQYGEEFDFDTEATGVVVVSFMFTRCPDVCPVLTQSLIAVQAELSEGSGRMSRLFLSASTLSMTRPKSCLNTASAWAPHGHI